MDGFRMCAYRLPVYRVWRLVERRRAIRRIVERRWPRDVDIQGWFDAYDRADRLVTAPKQS